jgi:hypothetical protein
MIRVIKMHRALHCKYRGLCGTVPMFVIEIKPSRTSGYIFSVKRLCCSYNLTLRLLMSYIYIYIYIYMEHLFLMFLDHTQRRTTVGRTPLDE